MKEPGLRSGWRYREAPSGVMIGYQDGGQPSVVWNHIDGPMLCARDGQIHWLTLWERLRLWLGLDDLASIEHRRFPEIATDRLGEDLRR